jgi:hypothetical protein
VLAHRRGKNISGVAVSQRCSGEQGTVSAARVAAPMRQGSSQPAHEKSGSRCELSPATVDGEKQGTMERLTGTGQWAVRRQTSGTCAPLISMQFRGGHKMGGQGDDRSRRAGRHLRGRPMGMRALRQASGDWRSRAGGLGDRADWGGPLFGCSLSEQGSDTHDNGQWRDMAAAGEAVACGGRACARAC